MSSRAEDRFAHLWDMLYPGVDLHSEHRFDSSRRWRFDFAHLPSLTAVEIEGGVWRGGRHTTGVGFTRDCEKYLQASALGWMVLRLTPAMITAENLAKIHAVIERRTQCP